MHPTAILDDQPHSASQVAQLLVGLVLVGDLERSARNSVGAGVDGVGGDAILLEGVGGGV